MNRFHDPAGMLRPAALSLAGIAVAAVAVVAIAGAPGGPLTGAGPSASPGPSSGTTGQPAARPTPTARPTVVPTNAPTSEPSQDGNDAMPIAVELITVDRHRVNVDVVDRSGFVVRAVSGRPAEGASVDGFSLHVANVDSTTLRLTWIDYPIDNRLALFVDDVDGHVRLALVRPAPTGPTDSIGFDRELVLSFDRTVDAASVEAILQDGLDTAS